MHAAVFAITSVFCREALPEVSGAKISYSYAYYTDIRYAAGAILKRYYGAAAKALSSDGYHDGKTYSAYGLVNFLERGYVRGAILSIYKTEFCAPATSIAPDYRGTPALKFRLGLEAWLRGDYRRSLVYLSEAIKPPDGTAFEEVNVARGIMALSKNPKQAFSFWRIALATNESPPPISEANIAAAELLLHYKP